MNKICTSIEQSKKLIELGIDVKTADMFLAINGTLPVVSKYIDDGFVTAVDGAVPCWSLAALMNIIEIEKVEICFNCNNNKYWVDVHFQTLGSFCQDHELYDSKIDALIAIIQKLKSRSLL